MASVLALGFLSFGEYWTRVSHFLADQDAPVRSIEVGLFSLDGIRFDVHIWLPKEENALDGIAEDIAKYVVEHQSASATILVRCDG